MLNIHAAMNLCLKNYSSQGGKYVMEIKYFIKDVETATKLSKTCERYKDLLDVDVIYGRHMVDGCSSLGVMAFMGKIVTVKVVKGEKEEAARFLNEVGKYEV